MRNVEQTKTEVAVVAAEDPEYVEALGYLRAHSPVDMDAFLAKVRQPNFLEQPVGPTPYCLTIDAIAGIVEGASSGLVTHLKQRIHLARCRDCRGVAEV